MAAGPPKHARVGIAILLAGLALATLGTGLRPGSWAGEDFHALRGPALTRYDAANGTTLVVPYCGHWHCDAGYLVEGDARDAAAERRFGLRATGEDAGATVRVEPPLPNPERPVPVATARQGPYEPSPIWPRAGVLLAGLALAGAGAVWLAGAQAARGARPAPAWIVAASLPLPGVAAGAVGAAMGEGGILLIFAAIPLLLLGVVLALFRRTHPYGLGLLLMGILAVAALVLSHPYFPSEPAL